MYVPCDKFFQLAPCLDIDQFQMSIFVWIAKQFRLMDWWCLSFCLSGHPSICPSVNILVNLWVEVLEFALQSGHTVFSIFLFSLFGQRSKYKGLMIEIFLVWYLTLLYEPLYTFYKPVFRRDVLWYGDVRPSGSPSIRPSVRHSFPQFSPTCFDILIWNFVYHFIFMHIRSSSNAINFRHFLQELCSFLTSNSFKYAVFRTFLLHALTYWVQILYMTLFLCTTEQVWVSSFCFNFCMSYASLWT